MRDSGGHSGNSYAETHVPLIMIGHPTGDCENNKEKFYKQIDFASTFAIINGLPIPASSIGSIIPEMLFNMTQQEKLEKMKMANQRLIQLVESDGSDEFVHQFEKAKSFHQMFANNTNNNKAFLEATMNYLASSQAISDRLGQHSLDVNLFQVLLGLFVNLLISLTIILPCDGMVKDLKLTARSFLSFIIGSFVLKLLVFNEIFQQTNSVNSFLIIGAMSMMLRIVFGILNAKHERFKWFFLFDHDLLYLLMLGQFFFVISVCGSSFVEEEHQIWYYLCNTIFCFFVFFEFRGEKNHTAIILNTAVKCFAFLLLHIVIRRMNATGDKWINVPDIGDWFHRDVHEHTLHAFIMLSMFASGAWLISVHCTNALMIPFVLIGNVLLYFHHTRSITDR